NAPLLPYIVISAPAKRLNTWDRFRIPLPFSRGAIVFGKPVIPEEGQDRDSLLAALQNNLDTALRIAEDTLKKKDRP
ncbi:MAG: hypothetical protein AAGH90_08215, partial [Pseudomonadota bacterium]